jgi:hypothetical protein
MESLLSTLLILVEVDYIIVVRHHTMSTTILIQPSAARHCYTNESWHEGIELVQQWLVVKRVEASGMFQVKVSGTCWSHLVATFRQN